MAEVLLFHHALGLTAGCIAFADSLRAAGHTVHTPDLYDGKLFDQIDEGVAFAEEMGFEAIIQRGKAVAEDLPGALVYAGFSLGILPAQALAQTRPGAQGALFFHGALPPSEFGTPWPEGLQLQIHVMEDDELGDLEFARALVQEVETAELFLYPGDRHLFADNSFADYDPDAAALLQGRVIDFLAKVT